MEVKDDGTVVDGLGNVRMTFNSYADAIAYLQHMSGQGLDLAEATDDRA